ncbi:hypothetical protein GXP67_20860 [Rhodocytophaga rosea]|uniref:WG repeat-containing protein n=1 Tax=Rhodocytophaga rosea TaxID=2704465 RepID=A0A6C0GLK6_9BACT|nr:hypothetical protein [Rhodocytophaga rosea]QHT68926.1 hypothetical protein GXP67_20860 [Rhodocytophaga rosea]
MRVDFKDYIIELCNDSGYALDSTDNSVNYQFQYFDGLELEDRVIPTSKHSISVSKNGTEISSAIIAEIGGATTIHDNSFLIKNDSIFICYCNRVYSLSFPFLLKNWSKELDWATCFEVYAFEDDLIVHGETQITRVDEKGNIKWQFDGRDIFVAPDGHSTFSIANQEIIVSDWEGYYYRLNGEGKLIEEWKDKQ